MIVVRFIIAKAKRVIRFLTKKPGKSIWLATGSRSDAKAAYRMLGNEKLSDAEILKMHKEATINRITDSESKVILAVQYSITLRAPLNVSLI